MEAFPRLSAWLGYPQSQGEPPAPAPSAAAAESSASTSESQALPTPEDPAAAAAAVAWLSPEFATRSSAAAAAPQTPAAAADDRPQRRRSPAPPVAPPLFPLAAPRLQVEPPTTPAAVELPAAPIEEVAQMVIEEVPAKPMKRAPPPPRLEAALRRKIVERIGDDAASHVHSFRRCGRCGKACDSGKCTVPHPAHLRRDRGATFSFSSYESLYACGACGKEFKEVVDAKNGEISSSKFVGELVCFCGKHQVQCLYSDQQRIHEHAVTLSRAHDLQEHLDAVKDDVEILAVTWGATRPVSVAFQPDGLRFLKLRVLSLQTLEGFRTVYLDQVTVPSLQDLTLQHKSRSCWVHLDLPQIRNLYLRSWEGEADCVRSLLTEAVELETFAARCLPAEDLRFCSDHLREVTVNRCESLRTLILDAPYLTHLRIDHCCHLDTIEFLHPSPTGGPLKVSSRGAYLGALARKNLRNHPRTVPADADEDAARSVFPLASYASEDHAGAASRALSGRNATRRAWFHPDDASASDSDDEAAEATPAVFVGRLVEFMERSSREAGPGQWDHGPEVTAEARRRSAEAEGAGNQWAMDET